MAAHYPSHSERPLVNALRLSPSLGVRKGDSTNLGGLDGADAHCAALVKAAGATKTNWLAYLSTTGRRRVRQTSVASVADVSERVGMFCPGQVQMMSVQSARQQRMDTSGDRLRRSR
jgi:hypothetical protein